MSDGQTEERMHPGDGEEYEATDSAAEPEEQPVELSDESGKAEDYDEVDEDFDIVIPRKDGLPPGDDSPAAVGSNVLSHLLDLMGLEGDVICEAKDDSYSLNIEGDDLGVLIGRRGSTLASLQHVVRLMVASQKMEWPVLSIDVCGYKKRRRTALEELARKLADQARYRRRSIALEPMPPDERRVVHLALATHPDVYTESTGDDQQRKVVIHPKRL
jgi:spoIIIJ-associated protein